MRPISSTRIVWASSKQLAAGFLLSVLFTPSAFGAGGCPAARGVLGSQLWEVFSASVEEQYLASGAAESLDLSPRQWAKLLGFALRRQARHVAGDEQRREEFACLEQGVAEALAAMNEGQKALPGHADEAAEALGQIAHEAAIGLYDEEISRLTGVDAGAPAPSIFSREIAWPPSFEAVESTTAQAPAAPPSASDPTSDPPPTTHRCRFNLHPSLYTSVHPNYEWVLIRHPLSRGGAYYHTVEVNPAWASDHPKRPENQLKPGQEIVARGSKAEILARVRELQKGCS